MNSIQDNDQDDANDEFNDMLARCRVRIFEVVQDICDAEAEHREEPESGAGFAHLEWVEDHLLAALFPEEYLGAQERHDKEEQPGAN